MHSTGKHRDETSTVFTALLGGILKRAAIRDADRQARLKSYFLKILEAATLSTAAGCKVRVWTNRLDRAALDELAVELSKEEMSEVVNALYVSISAEMGPVAADRIFSAAVTETDTLPEATRFPARALF